MNDTRHDVSWENLLGAVRRTGTTSAVPPAAPEEFVGRMRKLRVGLWEFARFLLWRRWAVFFTLAAALIYLGFYLALREPSGPSIPRPIVPISAPP
jgi:hypothetical protein